MSLKFEICTRQKTRASSVGAGVLLACLAGSAYALNGNIYAVSCACQTTSDFSAAAIDASNDQGWGGTYLVTSTSVARTALLQVHGKHLIDKFGNDYWLASSTIPMDDSGTSLAGQSESALEAFYQTYDQTNFGVDRNNPIIGTSSILPGLPPSFVVSTDVEVSTAINAFVANLAAHGVNFTTGIFSVTFPADGTSAEFVESPPGSHNWVWNGVAHNKNGDRIDRNGNVIPNPNTSGTGGGHAEVSGFGKGSGWTFDVGGFGSCTSVTTITVDGEATNYSYVHPC